MKKTYRHNRKPSSRRVTILAGCVITLFILIFFFSPIASFVHGIARPVFGVGTALSRASASVFSSFFLGDAGVRIAALERENENLRRTVENMQGENNRYATMLDRYGENATGNGVIIAGVLVAPPRSLYDTLVINRGKESGIAVGSQVYTAHDSFVGTVVAVSPYTALVELVSSPGYVAEALIGKEQIRTQVFGRGSGNLIAVLPRDIDIAEGDVVVVPGLGGVRIGEVGVIETEQNDPFQQVRIRVDVHFSTLTDVAVLPPTVTEFPEYVRHDDVLLDIDMEESEREEITEEDEADDSSATSSNETSEAPQG